MYVCMYVCMYVEMYVYTIYTRPLSVQAQYSKSCPIIILLLPWPYLSLYNSSAQTMQKTQPLYC
jgi:hypothetical protein